MVDLLYAEPLFKREWSGRTTPHLVESWKWENEGRSLWLRLKDGVLFHDGTPLTAVIVAEQLQRQVNTKARSGRWGFGSVTGVKHDGARSVTIELSQPDIFLLSALSDMKVLHPRNPDLATGPFRLVSRGDEVHTERFSQYHAGTPFFSGVVIQTYDTQRSAWAALMRDEVDAVQEVSRDSVEFMQGATELRTYSSLQPFYVSLVLNHRHPILGRQQMRRALSLAIDREEIVRVGMRGRGRAAVIPIWPLHWASGQIEGARAQQQDAPAARAQLEALDLPLRTFPDRRPSRARFHLMVYSEDPQYERIALLLQRQLHEVDIDLVIQLATIDEITARIAAGDFEIYMVPTNASRTLERLYRSWHSQSAEAPALLNTGYTGADDVLRDLRASVGDDSFQRNVQELSRRFAEDVPDVFIAWLEVTRAIGKTVSIGQADERDPFAELWRWRPAR